MSDLIVNFGATGGVLVFVGGWPLVTGSPLTPEVLVKAGLLAIGLSLGPAFSLRYRGAGA